MKKTRLVILAIVCITLICGGFYYLIHVGKQNDEKELTEIQKILTKDLEKIYPKTPREVIKLYNRILLCYYDEKVTEEELEQLVEQAQLLFDEELLVINPKDKYLASIKDEIALYKEKNRQIVETSVGSSNDVLYKQDGDDEIAYVTASYFTKENNAFSKTYQQYVLRKDQDGRWKMLAFYKVEGESLKDDE